MIKNALNYWITIKALLLADYVIFKKDYINKVINVVVITMTQIVVTVYILPYFGLQSDFGAFMIGGFIAAYPLWETYPLVAGLTSDLDSEKRLTYELLLPVPSFLIFFKMILSFTLQSIASSFLIIPISKFFVMQEFQLQNVSWLALGMMFFANSFFMGAFGILIASLIKHISQLETAWQRYIFPLWFLGGFQFSWTALHTIFPRASYLELLNPILYTNEGFRSALLSDPTYIAAYLCVPILYFFAFTFMLWGIKNLRKRIDFI